MGVFVLTLVLVGGWQAFEAANNPEVKAIKDHPVLITGTVVEPMIDGPGGDAAVSYKYSVAGHTYDGYDIGSAATGDVLGKNAGDAIPIQYAATMPKVSCVAESTDCPNNVYDPYLYGFVFWGLILLTAILVGLVYGVRGIAKSLRGSNVTKAVA